MRPTPVQQGRSSPRSIIGGPGPVAGRASDIPFPVAPSLPGSIMTLPPSSSLSSSSSSSSTPSPSASLSPSLNWAFSSIPNAVTCNTISINWTIFNSPSQLQSIYSSPSISSGIDLDITISNFGTSSIASVRGNGSPADVLGSGGVQWMVNVPAGEYDLLGVVRMEDTDTLVLGSIPPIETAFSVHQGDDDSCINNQAGAAAANPTPTTRNNNNNNTALVGGVVGGVLGFVALCLAALLYVLYFRRRHNRRRGGSSIHERPNKGWNGLTSVGSVVSTTTTKQDMEKHHQHHHHHSSFSQIVQEPGSPLGSPPSVELAHFSLPPIYPGRNSDPFATPVPSTTPPSHSELGHDRDHDDINESIKSSSTSPSLTHASLSPPASLSSTLVLSTQTNINKRGSHHSRKPVPTYDELNLTLEEREALGQSQLPQQQQQQQDEHNATATTDNDTQHAHARELYQNLRSKSSGHLKDETFVHYLIPDPPLEIVD